MATSSDGIYNYGTEIGSNTPGVPTDYSNTIFYRRTLDLEIDWSKKYDIYVPNGGMKLSSDDSYIYFSVYDTSNWKVGKMSSTDGSILSYKILDASVMDWGHLVISTDNNYLYVSSKISVTLSFIELAASDLSLSSIVLGLDSSHTMDLQPISLSGNSRSIFILSHHSTQDTLFNTFTFPSTTPIMSK